MILDVLNPEKIWHRQLVHLPPHLYTVATLPWEIQKVISAVLFIHTSDYLHHLRRKQTVIPLLTTPEKCHRTTQI